MIAERPKSFSQKESDSLELFAGLEFPTVPSHPLKVEPRRLISERAEAQIQEEDFEEAKDISETTNLLSNEKSNISENKSKIISPSTNLSTLYATEVITSESRNNYPELPQIIRRTGVTATAPPVSLSMNRVASHPATTTVVREESKGNGIELTPQGSTSTLVDELLQENSRLLDEVTRLRSALNSQSTTSTTTIPSNSTSSPTTGVSISNPNAPPTQGVKYVCCGACRQWLLVDKEAMLVACSNCEAINNCNLVQSQQTASNTTGASANATT